MFGRMFANLGRTLRLLRELRSKSQGQVAREAGIGKSQLSKYESGKELPKLDSLEKVLRVLQIGHFEFFYTLHLVDRRAEEIAPGADPERPAEAPLDLPEAIRDERLYLRTLLAANPLFPVGMDEAFSKVFSDLLVVYRLTCEQAVVAGMARSD